MNDTKLIETMRDELTAWDAPLAPDIAGRLRAARRAALAEENTSRPWWVPGFATASIAMVAMLTFGLFHRQVLETPTPDRADDILMLASEDDFELFDDVDFLLWLGEQSDPELG